MTHRYSYNFLQIICYFQLRKDDAEATKWRDTTEKIITNRQNPTFLLVFFILVNSVGGNYSVKDNNIFGRESPALFKILYEESTLADIWSLRPEIPPSLSHQCSSAPHSATSLAAEYFLMSADILRDFSRIKDGWLKR